MKEIAQSPRRQWRQPAEALCGGTAHAELKPRVIALRVWDAVAWCGRRMHHHVYSHFLCGAPSRQLHRHYSEHYLSQRATKEVERKAVLFSLYIWMLNSRLRYFAAGRGASAKKKRRKERQKEREHKKKIISPCSQWCMLGRALQLRMLQWASVLLGAKVWLTLDGDYPAILNTSM